WCSVGPCARLVALCRSRSLFSFLCSGAHRVLHSFPTRRSSDLRAELRRLLALTELWDERVGILQVTDAVGGLVRVRALVSARDRSEEHTSELQSRENLVCRLLLEKKNTNKSLQEPLPLSRS